jgi:hypothetical protein
MKSRSFPHVIIAVFLSLGLARPALRETRATISVPGEMPNDPLLLSKIDARLTAQGFSPHIGLFAAQIQEGKLTFFYYLKDHDYTTDGVVHENGYKPPFPDPGAAQHWRELSAFRGSNGRALWIKLFMAISEVSGISVSNIEGRTSLDPKCDVLVQMHDGAFQQTGQQCSPLMVGVPTEVDVRHGTAHLASGTNVHIPEPLSIQQVVDFTKAFLEACGGKPDVLALHRRYAQIETCGLKNIILVSEDRWEKINLIISDNSSARETSNF